MPAGDAVVHYHSKSDEDELKTIVDRIKTILLQCSRSYFAKIVEIKEFAHLQVCRTNTYPARMNLLS